MLEYLKAESLKQKRSFNNKIIGLTILVNILICFLLMGIAYLQKASYNWWYISFLPFTFTYIASSIVKKDSKYNYHGLFGIVKNKKKLWYAKIGIATTYLFMACIIFFVVISLCGIFFVKSISISRSLLASIVLFVTFAWQIPFFMFLTLKINLFVSILTSTIGSVFIACICAVGKCWWIPFAIPSRMMCPIIGVMPNGLPVDPNSVYSSSNVILPGVIITVVLYFVVAFITAKVFEGQEV